MFAVDMIANHPQHRFRLQSKSPRDLNGSSNEPQSKKAHTISSKLQDEIIYLQTSTLGVSSIESKKTDIIFRHLRMETTIELN